MLTGKQRRYLRGLGHHLEPVVLVGHEGVSEGVVGAVGAALFDHELVKVRLGENAGDDRQELATSLAEQSQAELVQVLGRTVLLYRRRAEEPEIELPGEA
jgi:RNA-binding protein